MRIARFLTLVMALTSASLETAAQQTSQWVVEETRGPLKLYSEFSVDVPAICQVLDTVTDQLDSTVGLSGSDESVEVILFSSHAHYVNYLAATIPQAKNRRAIFFRNGTVSQIYAWRSRTLMTDLRHEMVHVRIHQQLQFCPLWLDEGLAEYFEEDERQRQDSSRRDAVKWKARFGITPAIRTLEALPSADAMTADSYRDSWAWVSFLINDSRQSRGVLKQYLNLIHRGEAPGAFSQFAEAENPGLISRANSYFRKMSFVVTFDSSEQ